MGESVQRSWGDTLNGRERVRHVVETLAGPTTVQEIAERADVSRATAIDHRAAQFIDAHPLLSSNVGSAWWPISFRR